MITSVEMNESTSLNPNNAPESSKTRSWMGRVMEQVPTVLSLGGVVASYTIMATIAQENSRLSLIPFFLGAISGIAGGCYCCCYLKGGKTGDNAWHYNDGLKVLGVVNSIAGVAVSIWAAVNIPESPSSELCCIS